MNITARQKALLFHIVEAYAETAAPVGSTTMAQIFRVSPATIRAEMARLDALGLIAQPHTSAGRIPTDAGYRYYVNYYNNEMADYDSKDTDYNSKNLDYNSESANHNSKTTDYDSEDADYDPYDDFYDTDAAFVMNMTEVQDIESGNLLSFDRPYLFEDNLTSSRDDKSLTREKHVIDVRAKTSSDPHSTISSVVDALIELTNNIGFAAFNDEIYVSGMSRLFNQPEFSDIRRVQAIAELLDNIKPWLREAAPGEPLNIFIGHENPIGKNSDATLIISKFRSPFSDRSYIGVLGPTRQNYSRVIDLVRHAGNILEEIFYA